MYRVCIANMPFRHFLEHCFSDKKSKQVTIQNAMCFLLVCFSVGFALVCFCFACMFKSLVACFLAWFGLALLGLAWLGLAALGLA